MVSLSPLLVCHFCRSLPQSRKYPVPARLPANTQAISPAAQQSAGLPVRISPLKMCARLVLSRGRLRFHRFGHRGHLVGRVHPQQTGSLICPCRAWNDLMSQELLDPGGSGQNPKGVRGDRALLSRPAGDYRTKTYVSESSSSLLYHPLNHETTLSIDMPMVLSCRVTSSLLGKLFMLHVDVLRLDQIKTLWRDYY